MLLAWAAVLALLPAAPAHADSSSTAGTGHRRAGVVDPGVLRRQGELEQLADAVLGVSEGQRAYVPGYAGHAIDPELGHLTLYWHGDVPEHVTDLLAHAPAGIAATVRQAPYSLGRLREARDRLVAAAERGEDGAVWKRTARCGTGPGPPWTAPG
ncbi:hypothetical protein [Streptomyces sp. CBMA123]|uniref:hypothetical protein n=1 Tax=Streptomyces sp. CBMA123 TaxID=1896313 RepID=UPI001661D124|nr:hypothetical protein [Streptomyces sp. CBMA123]MBD0688807.1 hypothetical protein [Streptomyces sp. CBMA123]